MTTTQLPFAHNRRASTTQLLTLCFILVLASAGLYAGWRLFLFLTDDAYVIFRYVSNSLLGFGYTWNPPPFSPVEGYTSYLWVMVLDVVWRVTGVEPPDSANVISLFFAYGTTLLGVAMLLRMKLKSRLQRVRLPLLFLFLLGVLTNRTYLTWTSSGLETAMFNFFVTAWVFCCLFVPSNTPRWLVWMAFTSVFAALTRPDGLLLIAATLFLSAFFVLGQVKAGRFRTRILLSLTPFLITVGHLLWRRQKYGAWLPNSHAAKYVAAWPESGLRYLLSFMIEYSLWFWLILVLPFLFTRARRLLGQHGTQKPGAWERDLTPSRPLIALIVVGTIGAQLGYYTLIIGGDHFEYRVYSHLVLLIFLSSVWLLSALNATALRAFAFLGLFILCASPIPWTHWALTRNLHSREETYIMQVAISDRFPAIIRPYVDFFDSLQFWFIEHHVCMRHQEHKVFCEDQIRNYPPRSSGILLSTSYQPVLVVRSVGVAGWTLPTTSILDTNGINDYVVARNPVDPNHYRILAHDRYPPAGYTECFQPNVMLVRDNKLVVAYRQLTADAIADCENQEWPPSKGDIWGASNLTIDSASAPAVDHYLWSIWPSDPLYLCFVPPQQDSTQLDRALLDAFPKYTGLGCIVVQPTSQSASCPDYVLAFLPATRRPDLSELAEPFPWTQIVTECWAEQPSPYHLGYAAPTSPEIQLQPSQPRTAVWADRLTLLGYDLPRTCYQPGETIHLTVYYHASGSVGTGYSIFSHLLGTTYNPATVGPLWGQDDGDPCRGLYPMECWQPGSVVASKMAIPISPDAPPGDYELLLGLYQWQTGERVLLSGEMTGRDSVNLEHIQINTP